MMRLLLVEDYSLFRGALAVVPLDRQPDLEVAAQCGSLAECRSLGGLKRKRRLAHGVHVVAYF